jgi:hypothetical protein
VHEDGFRETNGFAGQALDPCSQSELVTLDLLGVQFADGMSRGRQVALIDRCRLGGKVD